MLIPGTYILVAANYSLWPFTNNSSQEASPTDQLNQSDTTYSSTKTQTNEKTTNNADPISDVQVGIASTFVSDSSLEIRAFISGVIEGTGMCTATVTLGDTTIAQDSPAFIDASTSQCEPIIIPLTDLRPDGEWDVKVSYVSPTSTGESSVVKVKIER